MDCFAKEWQGYHFLMSCLASDAISAVEYAVMRAFDVEVPKGLIFRTNNGPQYVSHQFRSVMSLLGIHTEYIQMHTPEDKGNIESFYASLKNDYVRPFEFQDYREA